MNAIGTLAWSRRTGGTLSPADRLRFAGQALLARLVRLSRTASRTFGLLAAPPAAGTGGAPALPDTADARRARDHAALLTPGWLHDHSLRAYLWASLLAHRRGIAHDPELLFVAAALHGLGLATPPRSCDPAGCFALRGAAAAGRFADSLGWPAPRRHRLQEAITLHLNLRVGLEAGAEAHLLHAGVALDCTGAGLEEISPALVAAVLARFPRPAFKARMAAALADQATVHYASRAAFLHHRGYGRLIHAAPFAD